MPFSLFRREKAAYEFRGGKEIVNGLSELHRIVGENDLEWKTAMISGFMGLSLCRREIRQVLGNRSLVLN